MKALYSILPLTHAILCPIHYMVCSSLPRKWLSITTLNTFCCCTHITDSPLIVITKFSGILSLLFRLHLAIGHSHLTTLLLFLFCDSNLYLKQESPRISYTQYCCIAVSSAYANIIQPSKHSSKILFIQMINSKEPNI